MEIQEALALLARVCEQYRGTLQDHQTIQAAFETVSEAVTPKDE